VQKAKPGKRLTIKLVHGTNVQLVAQVQKAIDEGWEPVWESFQMDAAPQGGVVYAMIVRREV